MIFYKVIIRYIFINSYTISYIFLKLFLPRDPINNNIISLDINKANCLSNQYSSLFNKYSINKCSTNTFTHNSSPTSFQLIPLLHMYT